MEADVVLQLVTKCCTWVHEEQELATTPQHTHTALSLLSPSLNKFPHQSHLIQMILMIFLSSRC